MKLVTRQFLVCTAVCLAKSLQMLCCIRFAHLNWGIGC